MTYQPKILAFAGSLRKDSYNKKLVKIAIQGAEEAGAKVTYIDLKDYPLPFYDQEIEDSQGLPVNALALKKMMMEHDGFLLSCPEYNSSMPAVFKNVIDWTSRKASPTEVFLSCFTDKAVALMSASQGGLGGIRGLVHVRSMFSNIFSIVLPEQKSIANATEAFDEKGNLKNAADQKDVMDIGFRLTKFLMKHKG
ncbi:MAG: NAD(P)H-dependent oxidoreductase [Verrucomicrobia bacterium]|nr:NAD(P)H-dependent oxidoreductase [Verrucomicrobiota bacterium]